jgi:hypothetical protein
VQEALPRKYEEFNVAAKLVVTTRRGGSQIALVGASGAELLASKVFVEPRAKGATLRSLKALMGDDVVVEDHTLSSPTRTASRTTSARKTSARKSPARKLAARTSKPARKSVRSTARRRTTAKAK